jgi:hypothetical protein
MANFFAMQYAKKTGAPDDYPDMVFCGCST